MKTFFSKHRWVSISAALMLLACFVSRGQFWDSSTGLLQAPSAEMNPSGTFMLTTNYLNSHSLSPRWGYNTFGYGINITFWSRLEIGYVCTIFDGKKHPNPSERDLIMINQDRHFSAKVLVLMESEFGLKWIPALAVGVSDPVTGSVAGEYIGSDVAGYDTGGNGYFNRYYAALTKHFNTRLGGIGTHLGYQYSKRVDLPMNGPCVAVDWMPIWLQKENVVATKLIAEYDARTFNIGAIVSLWRDHFEAMIELQAMKWITAGVRFKTVLKS